MAQEQKVTIKAKCNGVTRLLRITSDSKYEDVCDLFRRNFGVSAFELQYNDEEGDSVQLGSQVEMQEAVKVAEKFGPLKVTVITAENPCMNPVEDSKPSNLTTTSEGSQSQLSPEPLSAEQVSNVQSPAHTSDSQSTITEPMANLEINERPKERVRGGAKQGRKRVGFYASLCTDVGNMELATSPSRSPNNESSGKPKKKAKNIKGSKYYSSLAEDVAAMNLLDGQTGERDAKEKKSKQPKGNKYYSSLVEGVATVNLVHGEKEEKLMQKRKHDVSLEEMVGKTIQGGISEECDMKEKHTGSTEEDQPPTWFNKAFDKMSETVSSKVLVALNGAVIASIPTVNSQLGQPMKRDGASYIHDGITCDGCHQTIVGPRYKCGNCQDYDLCEQCEAIEGVHNSSHVFLKFRFPGIGIGRKHGVMIPLLKDIIYKNKNVELADEQDRRMKDVRNKLKHLAKKKREEQIRLKKGERKLKKFKGSNSSELSSCELKLIHIFVGDDGCPDGAEVAPEEEFTKYWKIRNGGTVAWNDETKLTYLYGAVKSILHEVELPHLQPGEEGTVSVNFIAPTELGQYLSVWRACHSGRDFGGKIWCKIKVVQQENQSDDDEAFVDANEVPPQNVTMLPLSEMAACKINEDPPEMPMPIEEPALKLSREVVDDTPNFHAYTVFTDSTPNMPEEPTSRSEADPADVSSPTQAVSELEWDTCVMDNESNRYKEEGMLGDITPTRNDDDLFDIEVISNASSDDFCVVPLPACFNPDIPLNREPEESMNSMGSVTEELPEDSEVDELRERSLADYTPSPPVAVPVKIADQVAETVIKTRVEDAVSARGAAPGRQIISLPPVEIKTRSVSSPPVSFDRPQQLPSVERIPFMPRLPASPPGRAVPVLQIRALSPEPKLEVRRVSHDMTNNDNGAETVRTQPPEILSSDVTVTSQPQGVVIAVSVPPAQSTAQFASTFVSGTLASAKRALGTMSDTVSTLISGNDGQTTVTYNQGQTSVHVVVPEIIETVPRCPPRPTAPQCPPTAAAPDYPLTAASPQTKSEMEYLIDMGFSNRPMNESLLKKYNNDVNKVLTELLHDSDNDWSSARHAAH